MKFEDVEVGRWSEKVKTRTIIYEQKYRYLKDRLARAILVPITN